MWELLSKGAFRQSVKGDFTFQNSCEFDIWTVRDVWVYMHGMKQASNQDRIDCVCVCFLSVFLMSLYDCEGLQGQS